MINLLAYWKTCTSNGILTAWIPMQDASMEMGTIAVLDGSHLWQDSPAVERMREQKSSATRLLLVYYPLISSMIQSLQSDRGSGEVWQSVGTRNSFGDDRVTGQVRCGAAA